MLWISSHRLQITRHFQWLYGGTIFGSWIWIFTQIRCFYSFLGKFIERLFKNVIFLWNSSKNLLQILWVAKIRKVIRQTRCFYNGCFNICTNKHNSKSSTGSLTAYHVLHFIFLNQINKHNLFDLHHMQVFRRTIEIMLDSM